MDGNYTAVCNITVTEPFVTVTGVTLQYYSHGEFTLDTGYSDFYLYAFTHPSNATNKNVRWSSSNSGVVSVSDCGIIYGTAGEMSKVRLFAVSPGTAVITATTIDGNYYDSCTVTVLA